MKRTHPLRDAALAISLLSVLPTGARWPEGERVGVAAWFPLVGAGFGLFAYAIVKAAAFAHATSHASLVVAAGIVTCWALLSRMLHWDGLADVADAYWGSEEPARRLEIMADSRTGAFGAAAITLVALLQTAAIASIIARPHELVVLLIPILSRFAATATAWLERPARAGGLAAGVTGRPSSGQFALGIVPVAGALTGMWLGYHVVGLAIGVLGLLLSFGIPHMLARRFGGVTGDVMGASVLLTETLLFAGMALAV